MSSTPAEHPPGPDHGHEAAKGGDPKIDKIAADMHAKAEKATGGAVEKPHDPKEDEHAAAEKPKPKEAPHIATPFVPSTQRTYSWPAKSSMTSGDEGLWSKTKSFLSLGVAGGAVATGSALSGLPIIGKLLGHSNAKTTERYAHLAVDPLRRATDAIGNRIAKAMGETTT